VFIGPPRQRNARGLPPEMDWLAACQDHVQTVGILGDHLQNVHALRGKEHCVAALPGSAVANLRQVGLQFPSLRQVLTKAISGRIRASASSQRSEL